MSITNDDDELPDWEVKDEEPPERLQKKWDREASGERMVVCRACKREISSENLTCIFCGTEIFEENAFDRLLSWIKRLFRKS